MGIPGVHASFDGADRLLQVEPAAAGASVFRKEKRLENESHPVFVVCDEFDNVEVLQYQDLNMSQMLADLHDKFGANRLTIQSGGNMNGKFLREDLIDYVNIVVAPVLVGGRDTTTLIDGDAISSPEELSAIRPLKLIECKALKDSYVQLRYEVIHRQGE